MDFLSFTLKATNGLLRELTTKVVVKPARILIESFNLPNKEIKVNAVWDTGATTTAISKKLVENLKLMPVSQTTVHGINHSSVVNVHIIDILLPNHVGIAEIKVTEAKNLGDCDVLIGMDIITLGDFSITNCNNQTFLSFRIPPDEKHIDYVEQAQRIRERREKRQKNRRKKSRQKR